MIDVDRSPVRTQIPEGFERRPTHLPFLIVGLIAVASLGALGYVMFARSVVYYRTPTEVLREPGAHVRLSGTVVAGSISSDIAAGTVAFDVTDGRTIVPVLFHGVSPDTLRDGGQAVAEGSLSADGTFRAQRLFARCPSKFQAATPGP
jgi:cytochrome c-type biogenesis protein CcmE